MSQLSEPDHITRPSPVLDRVPVQNTELELAVLGGIMLEPKSAYPIASVILDKSDFYLEGNGIIFEIMGELQAKGIPPDAVAVSTELKARGLLDKAGGQGVLFGMLNSVPTAANVEHHARLVRDMASFRLLIRASSEIIDEAYAQEMQFNELAENAIAAVAQLQARGGDLPCVAVSTLTERIFRAVCERAEAVQADRAAGKTPKLTSGLMTGYPSVDRMLGGLKPGEVTVVAGQTGSGKSAFALNVARNVAFDKVASAYYNVEMSDSQAGHRALSMLTHRGSSGVSVRDMDLGDLTQQQINSLKDAKKISQQLPVYFISKGIMRISDIRAHLGRMMRERKVRLLIVDYLQILTEAREQERWGRTQQVSGLSRGIKNLALDFNIPVLELSQLNREIDASRGDPRARNNGKPAGSTRPPRLSDLRESGSIEQDADNVLFLYNPWGDAEPMPDHMHSLELIVAKNRNGPCGKTRLLWDKPRFWMGEEVASSYQGGV
ncbi:MAG: DnaB-like helicase C-terminal domain-containing protein [Dehalococcoidia bacterium]